MPGPAALADPSWGTPRHRDYIAWYNGTRLHSALGYQTPDEYETATDEEVTAQAA